MIGEYHDVALAGDRLVDGVYEPIAIEMSGEGRFHGYSEALGLHVCWEDGLLRFFDPVTESYLLTHQEDEALARAAEERASRLAAESRAEQERVERLAAEARAAKLEAEIRRLRGE